MKFRPAAVPLITVDPYFSVWSGCDKLHDNFTVHWSGRPAPILAGVLVDRWFYSMTAVDANLVPVKDKVYQTDLEVTPLSTVYTFENEFAKVVLTFTTPLLLNRTDILCRPVSYIHYDMERKCDESKELKFVFGISARLCTNSAAQEVSFKKTEYSLCCGNTVQNPLSQTGDNIMIDWGYVHLCDRDAYVAKCEDRGIPRIVPYEMNRTYNPYLELPYMVVEKQEKSGVITIAYDEAYSVEYFGKPLREYYTTYFDSFADLVKTSVNEYDKIKAMCDEFDRQMMKEAESFGEHYQKILCLAYRQAVAAHKIAADENGELLFLSKECDSDGCIGTLDITYPSMPLFLKYNPMFVEAMLRPIIRYAKTDAWQYDFTPHDVGLFPIANGQAYGMTPERQMPVEETGNMLICLAATAKFSGGHTSLFEENKDLIKLWADYLVKNGYNPANQLCTDDFAGHLEHNCNLSLKGILGIAAYSYLSGDSAYMERARRYAAKWESEAVNETGATRLTFDDHKGWSLKYNIVWDSILGFDFFSDEVKKNEIRQYSSLLNRYGVPLDSRKDYTKLDWLMWSTCIWQDKDYFDRVCDSIVRMINETSDRVPLADWYYSSTADQIRFRNRSVVGALFIHLLR